MPHEPSLGISHRGERADELLFGAYAPSQQNADQRDRQQREDHQNEPRRQNEHIRLFMHEGDALVAVGGKITRHEVVLVDLPPERRLIGVLSVNHLVIHAASAELPLKFIRRHIRQQKVGDILVVVGQIFHHVQVIGSEERAGNCVCVAAYRQLIAGSDVVFLGIARRDKDFIVSRKIVSRLNAVEVDTSCGTKDAHPSLTVIDAGKALLFKPYVVFPLQRENAAVRYFGIGGKGRVLQPALRKEFVAEAVDACTRDVKEIKHQQRDHREQRGGDIKRKIGSDAARISFVQFHRRRLTILSRPRSVGGRDLRQRRFCRP